MHDMDFFLFIQKIENYLLDVADMDKITDNFAFLYFKKKCMAFCF